MHHDDAIRIVTNLVSRTGPVRVDWVSPAMSAVLAAISLQERDEVHRIEFSAQCQEYAENVGLVDVLNRDSSAPNSKQGSRCGGTYSPLASLAFHSEVESCNRLVNGVFRTALGKSNLVRPVCKVVGELHDNVASHACGRGYSAAKIYRHSSSPDMLEFAIADSGRGLLGNARRADARICTDAQAIRWALEKGTTSARRADPMAQR